MPTSITHTPETLQALRTVTNARIALGHTGAGLPIRAHLDFQLAHALARDAVNLPLDLDALAHQLQPHRTLVLQSLVDTQAVYLQRPDLGRRLHADSSALLDNYADANAPADIAIIIADGLSSTAVRNHASALVKRLLSKLQASTYTLAPMIYLVRFGRVAIGDEIGELLRARMSIVLIGERPGLSSPDSLGIYFTYRPRLGRTDAERNCISNIHANGLSYTNACQKLLYLIDEASRLQLSGIELKEADDCATPSINGSMNENLISN